MAEPSPTASKTYQNPVYGRSFPDPFVLKHGADYFAFCTGIAPDGRVFGVLHSRDLMTWTECPGAMAKLDSDAPFYWAPEVTYHNGKFYLYYSVGNETLMTLRVAVSDRPDGGYIDSGKVLTSEEFAIDAHVFRDDGGEWYMFYATDFLSHTHIGTGTVVDRMVDPFTLSGSPRPVTRAKYDWQVYDPARKEKGGVRWHTVEGPFVLKRKKRYYELFSGGNWQNVSYGVSFAVSADLEGADEWRQYSDGETTLPIMRTLAENVIGPGHNSVVVGPNNRELYCVYHRWVAGDRVMAIDRMDFAGGERLFVNGPTFTPQPAVYQPHVTGFSDGWLAAVGEWELTGGRLICVSATGEMDFDVGTGSFISEVMFRSQTLDNEIMGLRLCSDDGFAELLFFDVDGERRADWNNCGENSAYSLPADMDLSADHSLCINMNGRIFSVTLDAIAIRFSETLPFVPTTISLISTGVGAEFSNFVLTKGFEDLFTSGDLGAASWTVDGDGDAHFTEDCLVIESSSGTTRLQRQVETGDFDLAVNLAFTGGDVAVVCGRESALTAGDGGVLSAGSDRVSLPASFRSDEFHQFRYVSRGGEMTVYLDNEKLISLTAVTAETISINVTNATARIDMVRYTVI